MKVLRFSIAVLLLMCLFVGIHSYKIAKMEASVTKTGNDILSLVQNNQWEIAMPLILKIEEEWNGYNNWATLTINTKDIEQLEISLKQSKILAGLQEKSDFLKEFTMFLNLVKHISYQEGFHLKEIF